MNLQGWRKILSRQSKSRTGSVYRLHSSFTTVACSQRTKQLVLKACLRSQVDERKPEMCSSAKILLCQTLCRKAGGGSVVRFVFLQLQKKTLIKLQLLEILHLGNLIQHRRCVNQFISGIYKGSIPNPDTSHATEKMESWRWELVWYSNFLCYCVQQGGKCYGGSSLSLEEEKAEKEQKVRAFALVLKLKI